MKKGYTLVELLFTIAIFSIILAIGGVSFSGILGRTQLDTVAADIKGQMLRAQSTSKNGKPGGMYFDSVNKFYTYFYTAVYTASDTGNEKTNLKGQLHFSSITFPSNTAQFDVVTGELVGWTDPSQVILEDAGTGLTRTISVNRWGVVEVH